MDQLFADDDDDAPLRQFLARVVAKLPHDGIGEPLASFGELCLPVDHRKARSRLEERPVVAFTEPVQRYRRWTPLWIAQMRPRLDRSEVGLSRDDPWQVVAAGQRWEQMNLNMRDAARPQHATD